MLKETYTSISNTKTSANFKLMLIRHAEETNSFTVAW